MVNPMRAGFRLQDAKVGIIGLGLMGGSLAKALKGKCAALYGFDSHQPTLQLALATETVDYASAEFTDLSKVDLVVLSTPVSIILDMLPTLPAFIKQSCVLIDLGSTKKSIIESMNQLPENFDVIGSHPICGKEKLGFKNADVNLYQEAPFVITPLERTTPNAISAIQQIISAIGANCIEMTAAEHDQVLAFTSHLPFLLSSALVKTLPKEFAQLIGPGFRSTARLAGTPAHMMLGILKSNRENVLTAITAFRNSLNEIEGSLQNENYIELEKILNQSSNHYQNL